jgi:hypothetical protein
MKRPTKLRYRLLAPLVYLAAVVLLFEEWCWDVGATIMAFIAAWPPMRALEARIRALPPYAALVAFCAPAVLLLPVKVVALFAIARGHALWGLGVIVLAKLGGAAAVARLYALTRANLLSLGWFARWHRRFVKLKDRWIARLRATRIFRHAAGVRAALAASFKAVWAALFARPAGARRRRSRLSRLLRRFAALWRARRLHDHSGRH